MTFEEYDKKFKFMQRKFDLSLKLSKWADDRFLKQSDIRSLRRH